MADSRELDRLYSIARSLRSAGELTGPRMVDEANGDVATLQELAANARYRQGTHSGSESTEYGDIADALSEALAIALDR